MENIESVALLGTGIIGAAMGSNLVGAGFEVRAWNRTREKAEAIEGAAVCESPRAAIQSADAVLTVLSDGDAVREVMNGSDGALVGAGRDAVWVQASTVGVEANDQLAKLAAGAGIDFVDAPVLGTRAPAEKGELVVLAAGPTAAIDRCKPIFAAIGAKTIELGEAGAATRMKLVVNSWLLALTAGLAETVAFAEALGADPAKFLEILDGNPVGSPYAQMKGKLMLEREYEPASFPLRLATKDARLVVDAADSAGFAPSLASVIAERFAAAEAGGKGDLDMAAIYEAAGGEALSESG